MRRGRKVNTAGLIESREGSESAKRKAALLLRALAGELTMGEVAGQLGVNEAMAYRLRDELLAAAIESLEPRPVGRPPEEVSEAAGEVAALRAKVKGLERELKASEVREEILIALPEIGRRGKKKSGG